MNSYYVRLKAYLYRVCFYFIFNFFLYYIMTILTHICFFPYLWYLSHYGQVVQELFATIILSRIVQWVIWIVEEKVVNIWFKGGVQEYICQLSKDWKWTNKCYLSFDYNEGYLILLVLKFPQYRTNGEIFQDCGLFYYWVLSIHRYI